MRFGLAAVLSPLWALIPTGVVTQLLLGGYDAGPGTVVLFATLPFAPGPPLALIALFRNERSPGYAWFALFAYVVPGIIGVGYLSQCLSLVSSGHAP